jgi:malonate-semialdehyde dehydrogenase (acetylating)/methylmalonate-semialdehyde dehydrogenase
LIAKLAPQIRALRIGPGTAPDTDMGPLINAAHRERALRFIADGEAAGARLVVDGRPLRVPGCEQGFFLGGCLFDRVTRDMRIWREEIFGPVLCVMRAASLDAAIETINAHEYGNGTCIFTRDGATARNFAERVEVGMVGINVPLPVPVAWHSFGGWKRSLFGDLHAYGPDGVRFYTRRKAITQRWPDSTASTARFDFPAGSG